MMMAVVSVLMEWTLEKEEEAPEARERRGAKWPIRECERCGGGKEGGGKECIMRGGGGERERASMVMGVESIRRERASLKCVKDSEKGGCMSESCKKGLLSPHELL